MYQIHSLNPISPKGNALWTEDYAPTPELCQADAVMVRSAAMHDLPLPEKLLAVARAGAGVNNIPLESCAQKGIVVFNTPGANANSVMELALCGMLLGCRDIVGGINWVQSIRNEGDVAKKVEKGKSKFAGHEIRGKRLGVIGLGAIGGPLANAARRLGMQVYGCDPFISIDAAWHLDSHIHRVKTREEIYEQCDIITIHVPLLEDTRKMINAEAISKMKDGVIIVNTSRGGLVNTEDLIQGLKTGKIGAACLDVYEEEGDVFYEDLSGHILQDDKLVRLIAMPNVIVTSHQAFLTREALDNIAKTTVTNLVSFFSGNPDAYTEVVYSK